MAHTSDVDWRERFKRGGWIPRDQKALDDWLRRKVDEVRDNPPYLHLVIQELQHLIETDPAVYMGFNEMLKQNPSGIIQDTPTMLALLSNAISSPPEWNKDSHPGLAINTIISSIVISEFGFATFLNPNVNAVFKKILDAWTRYLATPDSAKTLTRNKVSGWLSDEAIYEFSTYLPGFDPKNPSIKPFIKAFVRNPHVLHWGFLSWDNFFARRFLNINVTRPLPPGDTPDSDVIVSACESTIYNIKPNASEFDTFWLKDLTYSLKIMLNDDEMAPQFYGGTVYQAFLDVTDYHRWHSPVAGTVTKIVNVPGTYYALPPAFDDPITNDEVHGIVEAQSYLAVAATRALIFIESDNPTIGLVCFIAVGMIEVSSCEITVRVGDHVNKGDQIGTFHFGGSTHCLVFRPGLKFTLDPQWRAPPDPDPSHVPIRSKLGTLTRSILKE